VDVKGAFEDGDGVVDFEGFGAGFLVYVKNWRD
jgi:hypothetical protein